MSKLNEKEEQKIRRLTERSKEIFRDCLLPNNCLVAAPSHMPYYPAFSKSYLYCWAGRDLGYNVTGALYLGIDVFEEVLNWIWERSEGYKDLPDKEKEGLLFRNYYPNGRIKGTEFQPDQTGTLLWAIYEYQKNNKLSPVAEKMIKKSTEGLANAWNKDHFSEIVEDLWEERTAHPRFKTNLTYTLAACLKGLKSSTEVLPSEKAKIVAEEMESLIEKAYDREAGYFLRRFGGSVPGDKNIDASMLGLVWPFGIIDPSDKRMVSTVKTIEEKIVDKRGVYRYQFDEYEGEKERGDIHYKQGAGAWPLITFWMSIVQSKMGDKKKAEDYFWKVVDQVGDDFLIPEQFFSKEDTRVGVKPLLWSHMMFVHAAKELGYI